MKINKKTTGRFQTSGMTLIEVSLVIALMLGLISVAFLGIGAYRKGSDKARCRMQLAAVQKAVRAQANFQNLSIGASFTSAEAFGAGKALETAPVCPSGGAYSWAKSIPALHNPFGSCDYTDADGATTHALVVGISGDTRDW
jgi:type II secretory pathway pseudopilin PulG